MPALRASPAALQPVPGRLLVATLVLPFAIVGVGLEVYGAAQRVAEGLRRRRRSS